MALFHYIPYWPNELKKKIPTQLVAGKSNTVGVLIKFIVLTAMLLSSLTRVSSARIL